MNYMSKLKNYFPEFYQEKLLPEDLNSDKNNIIILDTNYLLDILRYPTNVATKYLNALEKVCKNIYIPYLVALEFNFQKSNIKKRKKQQVDDYKNHIDNSISKLRENINKIDLINDTTEKESFTSNLIEITENFHKKLKIAVEKNLETAITNEEQNIYDRLIDIIGDKIGEEYSQQDIDKIEKEGITRYEQGIPPGFSDEEKGKDGELTRSYGKIKYQKKYGDLIIWKDILKYSQAIKNASKVIFITNDGTSNKKHDLMYRVGSMTVGPHISLLNEMKIEAKKDLYILSNVNFIQQASKLTDDEIDNLIESTSMHEELSEDDTDSGFLQKLYERLLEIDGEHPNYKTELSELLVTLSFNERLRFALKEKEYTNQLNSILHYLNKEKKASQSLPTTSPRLKNYIFDEQHRGGWTTNFEEE